MSIRLFGIFGDPSSEMEVFKREPVKMQNATQPEVQSTERVGTIIGKEGSKIKVRFADGSTELVLPTDIVKVLS